MSRKGLRFIKYSSHSSIYELRISYLYIAVIDNRIPDIYKSNTFNLINIAFSQCF